MRPVQAVLGLVVMCLISSSLTLSLPGMGGLFNSFTGSRKSDDTEPQEVKEQQDKHPTTHKPTRPPLIPAIPHPADHPLNPLNNPNHPLHPDNLPHLPPLHFPTLPHFTRETIHATKTVFVEVTDRLTIHPVCMTAYHVTPPCLPYDPHHHQKRKDQLDREDDVKVPAILHTPVMELEPTRILGGETFSDSLPALAELIEQAEPVERPVLEPSAEEARSARYMELTPSIATPEKVEIKDAPSEHPPSGGAFGTSPLNVVHNLLNHHPVTHFKTKTLLVTKVEKVLDTRVTATLVAENCIPTNSHIPLCAPHSGLVGPGYHGIQGGGIYTETFGGHIVAGIHTEKQPEYQPEGEVHEQVHIDKDEHEHQAKEELGDAGEDDNEQTGELSSE